jgi:hypothetical protein
MAFTRRDLFWYCAGVLTVAVIALLMHALNGSQNSASAQVSAHGGAAVPRGGSIPSPDEPASGAESVPNPRAAGSMDEMLARLESRLAAQGGSDADWELLAQTYQFIGRTDDAKLARSHHLPPSATANVSPAAAAASDEPAGTAGTASTVGGASPSAAAISGNVDLAAALKSKVPEGLTLFIVAKSVDSPGPPVAIIRTTTGHWPLAFTLDDSNSMMPGRTLSSARRVTIEARISRAGVAAPQPGDFQSSIATIDARQGTAVRILIDHVIG